MNTLLSIVVAVISSIISFANWMKIQLVFGLVIYILISNFSVAKANPGFGACGQCTSNIIGLSADVFGAIVLLLLCVIATIIFVIKDKKEAKAETAVETVYVAETAVEMTYIEKHLASLDVMKEVVDEVRYEEYKGCTAFFAKEYIALHEAFLDHLPTWKSWSEHHAYISMYNELVANSSRKIVMYIDYKNDHVKIILE